MVRRVEQQKISAETQGHKTDSGAKPPTSALCETTVFFGKLRLFVRNMGRMVWAEIVHGAALNRILNQYHNAKYVLGVVLQSCKIF